MMREVIIRRATGEDLGSVSALLDDVDDLHRHALPWLFREVDDPLYIDFLEPYVSKPDHAMFLAVEQDAVAGALCMFLRQPARAPIVRPTVVAEIDTLVVRASSRRRNIGSRLVNEALQWAARSGATRTELGVYEFNEPARAFWASVGFTTLSRRMVRQSPSDT